MDRGEQRRAVRTNSLRQSCFTVGTGEVSIAVGMPLVTAKRLTYDTVYVGHTASQGQVNDRCRKRSTSC